MSGVKGRSGRKKSPRDVLRYLTEEIDDNWADLVSKLIDKARDGDREALMYCFDRRLGKPKQQTELTGGGEVGVGLMVEILKSIQREKRELGGEVKLIGEGSP